LETIIKTTSNKIDKFIDGVAQILDIFPAKNKIKLAEFTSPRSDMDNLVNDWHNVGDDMKSAMQRFERDYKSIYL